MLPMRSTSCTRWRGPTSKKRPHRKWHVEPAPMRASRAWRAARSRLQAAIRRYFEDVVGHLAVERRADDRVMRVATTPIDDCVAAAAAETADSGRDPVVGLSYGRA
jgi:hypothetical protein